MTTYTNLVVHIVFSTKRRMPVLERDLRARLFRYVGGIVRGERAALIEVGGVVDHVHLLARLRADQSVAELVRVLKSNSSKWIRRQSARTARFEWQVGYGAFTVSESQIARVRAYIARQEEHHRHRTFREELVEMLERHAIDYEDRFLP